MTAAGGNPSDAAGVAFDGARPGGVVARDVVNIAGCPTHPGRVTETLSLLAAGEKVARDALGRPRSYADHLVHHGCPKNEFHKYKASARELSEIGCMMENLGCIGTRVVGDCNTRPWNGEGRCTRGGYPCISCTAPGFEDPAHALTDPARIAGIPVGLPTEVPKTRFMALAALPRVATPARLAPDARGDRVIVPPTPEKTGRGWFWARSTGPRATWG